MYAINGDVIFHKEESKPKGLKSIPGDLIHKGENHHHRISGEFKLFGNDEVEYIECLSPCELLHEEHKTRVLPKGIWRKSIALEYDHLLEESRRVID